MYDAKMLLKKISQSLLINSYVVSLFFCLQNHGIGGSMAAFCPGGSHRMGANRPQPNAATPGQQRKGTLGRETEDQRQWPMLRDMATHSGKIPGFTTRIQ